MSLPVPENSSLLSPAVLIAVAAVGFAAFWWIYRSGHEKCPPGMSSNKGSFTLALPAVDDESHAFKEARRDFTRTAKSGNILIAIKGKKIPILPRIAAGLMETQWREIATALLEPCHLDSAVHASVVPRLPQLINTSLGVEFMRVKGLPMSLLQPKFVVIFDGSALRVALYAYLAVGKIIGDRPDCKRSSWAVRLVTKPLSSLNGIDECCRGGRENIDFGVFWTSRRDCEEIIREDIELWERRP